MVRNSRRYRSANSDPSPDEIRRKAEDIRKGWSVHELNRRAGYKPVAWFPPIYAASEVPLPGEAELNS